jgi:hypothetical protein
MAIEPKRYAQRGTKVGEKTKLRNLPTALRDEPSYGRSLSFRSDSPKTSTGGSGGSNLTPRSRVDMASGNRNIGSQGSNAKNIVPRGTSQPGPVKPTAGPKNIVPRGTSQPGPVKPEMPSSARTMKDVHGINWPSRAKALSGPAESLASKASTGGSGGSNLTPRSRVDMASGNRNIGSQGSNAKNIPPRGTSQPGPVKSTAGPAESLASKASRVSNLSRAGLGIGAALYSKNAGEGSDFKGKDRPTPYSGLKLTGYDIPKDFGMKKSSEDWEDKKSTTPKASAAKTRSSKGESQASKDTRMAAYEDWVKTNRDPATASYLKTGQMKKGGKVKIKTSSKPMKTFAKGGSVKSSTSSRGDGCITKGRTKGRIY